MNFDAVQNTFICSSCSILLGKVAGVHGLEWHECDAFEAHNKLADFGSLTDFFSDGEKAPHSCHSSSRTPTILPKKNAELQCSHMDYGFMDVSKFIFQHGLWMDGFWGGAKKQHKVIKKNSSGPLAKSRAAIGAPPKGHAKTITATRMPN